METPPIAPPPDYAHRVAMYDMDRTITRSGTYSGFLMHVARRRQQWRLLLLPLVGLAGAAYALRLIDRSRLKAINLRLLVGRRFARAEIAPLAASYADKVVARGLHPAALEQIAADRAAGYRLLLATASFHLYVDEIAKRLGIEDVLATELDEPDGADHIHARLSGDNCYGDAKFARIDGWMAANAITRDAAHIRAYSDHVSDAPTFALANEAWLVGRGEKFVRLAARHGWRVADFEDEAAGTAAKVR